MRDLTLTVFLRKAEGVASQLSLEEHSLRLPANKLLAIQKM